MARPWRIEYEGALYHVFSRGNNRQDIFVTDDDRRMFLDTVGQMSERFESRIFAYVLMDNHYHLRLRTARANLSRNMQWLGTTYTRRYNVKHFQSGHLFQGRFSSILVENAAYLMQLSYYIHHNPLRAGIVRRLIDYRWSSYPAYAYNRRPEDWLDKELVLSQIRGENKHQCYRKRSQQYSAENPSIREDIHYGFIFGSQKFVKKIKARYMTGDPDPAVPQQISILKDDNPVAFSKKATGILQCDLERNKSALRVSQSDKVKRDVLIYLLWQQGSFTNKQIGAVMGLTPSAVSRRVRITKNKIELEQDFAERVKRIKSLIKP
jgi:putative transposase